MIAFSTLRTRRLNVKLRELTIGETMYLCKLPSHLNEAGTTALLEKIVEPTDKPARDQVTDPRLWTVHERAFVVAHYIAHVGDEPDFAVGKDARYSNYLNMDKQDVRESIDLGLVAGDKWIIRPLLGIHAESIERLINEERIDGERQGWWLGAMAAMMTLESGADVLDAELDRAIEAKVNILKAYPATEFMELLNAFFDGISRLDHFFQMTFLDDGIAWEVPGLHPARFQFSAAINETAWSVFGKPEEPDTRADSILQPTDAFDAADPDI